jgi:protein-tyrosine phosphatase
MNEDANIVDPDQAAAFTMGDFYIYLLEQGQSAIAQVLRIIAQASDQPGRLLFHCAHGKDRTGVIAALLLGLVGVADADIVSDYAQTEENISSIKKQIYELYGIASQVDALIEEVFSSRPENMQKMLGFINEKYGGASGYITAIGLTEAERDAIARMMLS